MLARLFGDRLSTRLGQPIVVENKGGASGGVGTDMVAKAPGDGYTLLVSSSTALTINPAIQSSLPYDPVRDFAPVYQIAGGVVVMLVPATSSIRSVADLVAASKAKPGTMSYGSWGVGSSAHFAMEITKLATGADIAHAPYKGVGPVVQDLIGGHVPVGFSDMGTALPHVRSGALRPIAQFGERRAVSLPDVPTLVESGVPFDVVAWIGMLAPASTPRPIIDRLNAEMRRIAAEPDVAERLRSISMVATGNETPDKFRDAIAKEIVMFRDIAARAGIKAE
ncbi:MAG: tripartite tricarboxylate transporter substrate binding protein [Alphaproteobacteria bacterium]|nr:tripartite tricarboxylate transporter substrate binding protein [Alphaproteobacteria bacterium]